jgi:hypothetical protein
LPFIEGDWEQYFSERCNPLAINVDKMWLAKDENVEVRASVQMIEFVQAIVRSVGSFEACWDAEMADFSKVPS